MTVASFPKSKGSDCHIAILTSRPDANHRHMTGKAVRDVMVAKGWLAEGDGPNLVVMCVPQRGRAAAAYTHSSVAALRSIRQCPQRPKVHS